MVELRRFSRVPLDISIEFSIDGRSERYTGRAQDISVGGMFIEVDHVPAFNAAVVIYATLPPEKAAFKLPGVVRWVGDGGMGVQFGLLGARETHRITELLLAAVAVVRKKEAP